MMKHVAIRSVLYTYTSILTAPVMTCSVVTCATCIVVTWSSTANTSRLVPSDRISPSFSSWTPRRVPPRMGHGCRVAWVCSNMSPERDHKGTTKVKRLLAFWCMSEQRDDLDSTWNLYLGSTGNTSYSKFVRVKTIHVWNVCLQ